MKVSLDKVYVVFEKTKLYKRLFSSNFAQIIDTIKAKWLRSAVAKRSFCSFAYKNICSERAEVNYAICVEFSGVSTNYMAT